MNLFEGITSILTTKSLQPNKTVVNSSHQPTFDILPESLRYKMKYGQNLDASDTLSLAHDTNYNILAPYFALKMLHNSPDIQKEMVNELVTALSNNDKLHDDIRRIFNGLSDSQIETVHPNKLSRVSLWSPSLIRKRSEEIINEVHNNQEIPVLIGYSGFLALEASIKNMFVGNTTLLVIPSKINSDQTVGFSLNKNYQGITVKSLEPKDLQEPTQITLIDDAMNTGKTFNQVSFLFANSQIKKAPLFVTSTR